MHASNTLSRLIRDVRLAISFDIMTSEHADSFCHCMNNFVSNLRVCWSFILFHLASSPITLRQTTRAAVHLSSPSPTLGDQGGDHTGIPGERINHNNHQEYETNVRRNQIEIKITGIRWRTTF